MKHSKLIPLFSKVLPLVGLLGVFIFGGTNADPVSLPTYASKVLDRCSDSNYRPGCYDEEIPKLMNWLSMEQAFQVTKLVQQQDPAYSYCHVLGHNLSAREVDKDPSRWKEVVTRCPSGMCSNGCIHGGFQERFRAEALSDSQIEQIKPDLESICKPRPNWNPTDLEKSSCSHALGHLAMYITAADIRKSLALCQDFASHDPGNDTSQVCMDGVFMQIFQPLEPEDFVLVKGKTPSKGELLSFCHQFTGKAGGSCLSEAWPLTFNDISTPNGLVSYCGQAESSEEDRCFLSLEYVLVTQFKFDLPRLKNFCAELPIKRSGACFAHIASRLIETDYRNISKSVAVCADAVPYDPSSSCYKELLFYSTFNFHADSPEQHTLCQSLPDPWSTKCKSRNPTEPLGKI